MTALASFTVLRGLLEDVQVSDDVVVFCLDTVSDWARHEGLAAWEDEDSCPPIVTGIVLKAARRMAPNLDELSSEQVEGGAGYRMASDPSEVFTAAELKVLNSFQTGTSSLGISSVPVGRVNLRSHIGLSAPYVDVEGGSPFPWSDE